MNATASTLTDTFARFTRGFVAVVTFALYRDNVAHSPLAILMNQRMNRLKWRFEALLAQFRAGTLPPPPKPRPSRAAPNPAAEPRPARHPGLCVRAIAAMLRPVPEIGRHCCSHLAYMLDNEAETRALVEACPQAGRVLRPYCRMLEIKLPPWLKLPRRKRGPRKPRKPRPIDVTKLDPVAYGNLIHPEREPMGWRPSNRTGYAPARPPPRDYRPPKDE